MRLILMCLVAAYLPIACGPDYNCVEETADPPNADFTKSGIGSFALSDAQLRDDNHGLCRMAGDYLGGCDPECSQLAWFCGGNQLYALDCAEVILHGRCTESATTWFCTEETSFDD